MVCLNSTYLSKIGLADHRSETGGLFASLTASPFLSTPKFHLLICGLRSKPPFREWWNFECFNISSPQQILADSFSGEGNNIFPPVCPIDGNAPIRSIGFLVISG